jgi:hypothetical protein
MSVSEWFPVTFATVSKANALACDSDWSATLSRWRRLIPGYDVLALVADKICPINDSSAIAKQGYVFATRAMSSQPGLCARNQG